MCKSIPRTLYTTLPNVNDTTDEDKMANKTVTMSLFLKMTLHYRSPETRPP